MGGRPGGDATVEEMESGNALLVDGGGCVVQICLGGTVEGQDGRGGGGGVRTHPETGPWTPTRAIADGCRQRVLQPLVSGLDDASEDPSFLDVRRYQVVGGGTIQSDVEGTHVPLLYRPQYPPVRGRLTRLGAGLQCDQTPQYRHGPSRRDVVQPTPGVATFVRETSGASRASQMENGGSRAFAETAPSVRERVSARLDRRGVSHRPGRAGTRGYL